jgi:hypothetical protein
MSLISKLTVPAESIPDQYKSRAADAIDIGTVKGDRDVIASRIALAELGQIVFFITQTVIFSLAYSGILPPTIAGIISFTLIPLEALCSYNTFLLLRPFSRIIMTAASIVTLSTCAGFALFGIVGDSAITLCGGGVALHLFRNISECIDTAKAKKDPNFRRRLRNTSPTPIIPQAAPQLVHPR